MRVVLICQEIYQFRSEKRAIQGEKVIGRPAKARATIGGFEFGQGGKFFFGWDGENNFSIREDFDGAVECRPGPFRAFGDGANLAGCSGEECYYLGCFGVIESTYANSLVFGQHFIGWRFSGF